MFLTGILFIFLSVPALGEETSSPRSPSVIPTITVPELTEEEKQVSQKQAEQFVNNLVEAVTSGSGDFPIDVKRFSRHIGIGMTEDDQTLKILEQLAVGMSKTLTPILHARIEAGGDYSLHKIYESKGQRHVLMRLLGADSAINYHDFRLVNGESGVVAEDFDNYIGGELMSQTMSRIAMATVHDQKLGFFRIIPGARSAMSQNMKSIAQMGALMHTQPRQALEIYASFPPELKKEKIVQIYRLSAASRLEEDDYTNAVAEFTKIFPNDPSQLLISVDYLVLKGSYAEALQAVDQLDQHLGKDPYLNVIRGGLLVHSGDKTQGVKLARQAADSLLNILPVHWSAVDVMLHAEDHEATLELLKEMDSRFEVEWHDLSKVEAYSAFCRSPSFAEWQKFLKDQNKTPVTPET